MKQIIINGEIKMVYTNKIDFKQAVELSGIKNADTITFRNGKKSKPQGILSFNEIVPIKSGMIFDVANTGNA